MTVCADLGQLTVKTGNLSDLGPVVHSNVDMFGCRGVPSGSPSRLRRRERRAAEQAAVKSAAAGKVATEKAVTERVAAEKAAAERVAAEMYASEKAAAEKCAVEKAAAEKYTAEKAAAEKCAAEKAAAEKCVAEKPAAEKCAAEKCAAEKVAAEKCAAKKGSAVSSYAEKAAAERAAEAAETTSVSGKDVIFTPGKSSCVNCDADMTPDHQCGCEELVSSTSLAEAEQKFSEFRSRWIQRLEKSTDDWGLKTKLLECLEDAYLAPVSVLSDGDFKDVKDKFFEGILSPVRFLEELQKLLGKT